MVQVEVVATDELGDRSYVVHDGTTALAVDPQRDIDRVQSLLTEAGLRLGLVLETHRHNDYVTGGYALAQVTGARYAVPAAEDIDVGDAKVADGDVLTVGGLTVTALATPGHTHGHLSYVVRETGGSAPPAVFSGGSLLFGSVGRTDLLGDADTDGLTRDQFRSVRRLTAELPDDTAVYPTHGFGSFCSSGSATGGDASTIGAEKQRNDALTIADEDQFVETLIAGLTGYPAYYAHMGARNKAGADAPDLSPVQPVDAGEIRKRIADGEWIVDLRERRTFAAGHLNGSISIALGTQFSAGSSPGAPRSPCSPAPPSRSPTPSGNWSASASNGRPAPRPSPSPRSPATTSRAATRSPPSPTWPPAGSPPMAMTTADRGRSSTSAGTTNGSTAASPNPCTCRCTS